MSKIQGTETIVITALIHTGTENSYGEPITESREIIVHNTLLFPGSNEIDPQRLGSNEDIDYTIYFPRGYQDIQQLNIQTILVRGEQMIPVKTVRAFTPRKGSMLKKAQVLFVKRNVNFGGTSNER